MSAQSFERLLRLGLANPSLTLKALDRLDCQARLIDFIKYFWRVTDPAQPFIPGWPVEAICEHLEAVTKGDIRRLLLNVPPGFNKSTTTDVFWPAWEWGPRNKPATRYLAASYSQGLTIRDNQRFLRVISDQVYREFWGDRFALERTGEIKVQNDRTGWKLATSVGGIGTGERANRVIIDDPNSVKEAESDAVRDNTNLWFREVVPDRLNSQVHDAIIVIQQRTHESDVSGTALAEQLGYEHVMIPMEYDSGRHCVTVLGWSDPRQEDGELAWPARFPASVINELKRDKGPYAYAGQYQQSPEPRGGGIFKRDWWVPYPKGGELFGPDGKPTTPLLYPPMEYIVASLDCALTTKEENDFSALSVWGVWVDEVEAGGGLAVDEMGNKQFRLIDRRKMLLMDCWKSRLEFNELVEKVIRTCRRRRVDTLLIEAKAQGHSVSQEIHRLCSGQEFGVRLETPVGDKVARAYSVQHLFSAGLVWAPDRVWAEQMIDEMGKFPRGAHDDLVDTATAALRYLRGLNLAMTVRESDEDWERRHRVRGEPTPLYDI